MLQCIIDRHIPGKDSQPVVAETIKAGMCRVRQVTHGAVVLRRLDVALQCADQPIHRSFAVEQALYKQGWSRFKLNEYEACLDPFLGVLARYHAFELIPAETSFFLSRQAVVIGGKSTMAAWRRRLFGWMLRNAQPASDFFRIPPNRAIEIGTQVVI